jgi:TRAP-type C4-dicarboxylate transport system permease small subunit
MTVMGWVGLALYLIMAPFAFVYIRHLTALFVQSYKSDSNLPKLQGKMALEDTL